MDFPYHRRPTSAAKKRRTSTRTCNRRKWFPIWFQLTLSTYLLLIHPLSNLTWASPPTSPAHSFIHSNTPAFTQFGFAFLYAPPPKHTHTFYRVCNNNSDSYGSLSDRALLDTSSPSDETGEEYDEDYTYEDQENGSSVDIETEADDDECNLFEAQFEQRTTNEHSWVAPNEYGSTNEDLWNYNERAYEELCYVTFSSEVITICLCPESAVCRFNFVSLVPLISLPSSWLISFSIKCNVVNRLLFLVERKSLQNYPSIFLYSTRKYISQKYSHTSSKHFFVVSQYLIGLFYKFTNCMRSRHTFQLI